MGRLFGTDGARGVANSELTCELAMKIGRAAAMVLTESCAHKPKVLIGMDTRASSHMLAAAIGAGLPVAEPMGSMIVDIGGGTSEVAIISLGGIVTARSVRVAGDEFDSAIINFIKKKYNLLIGERTAENIKVGIGSAFKTEETEPVMDIKGRNLLNGLPENITITSEEVRQAISEPLSHVIDAIKTTLEKCPPELAADIIESGIMLAGGGALLKGLDLLIHEETGMPVKIAERPLDCVADGTGKVLENIDKLEDVLSEDETIY